MAERVDDAKADACRLENVVELVIAVGAVTLSWARDIPRRLGFRATRPSSLICGMHRPIAQRRRERSRSFCSDAAGLRYLLRRALTVIRGMWLAAVNAGCAFGCFPRSLARVEAAAHAERSTSLAVLLASGRIIRAGAHRSQALSRQSYSLPEVGSS